MKQLFSLDSIAFPEFWTVSGVAERQPSGTAWRVAGESASLQHDFDLSAPPSGFTLELEFEPHTDAQMVVDFSPFFVWLNDPRQPACICQSLLGNAVVQNRAMAFRVGQRNRMEITCRGGRVDVELNGELLSFSSDYEPSFDRLTLKWYGPADVEFHRLTLSSNLTVRPGLPARAERFDWQMTVDFCDDIIPAPCTRPMLEAMMRRLADQGYKQVNWVYHGDRNGGFWDPSGDKTWPDDHIARTFANLGDSDLRAGVAAAHVVGLKVHAIIKPFDLSIGGANFPGTSPLGQQYGKYDVLGGRAYFSFDFVAKHPELCMRRRSMPAPPTAPVRRITFRAADPDAVLPSDTEIWVSPDNWKYERYTRPFQLRSEAGRLTIDGLSVGHRFFAIRVPGHEGKHAIHNSLSSFIEIIDATGAAVPFTYGLQQRTYWQRGEAKSPHLNREYDPGRGFADEGFFFDALRAGIPSSLWCGDRTLMHDIALDNARGVIGIAIGKNAFVPGVMCPSEPGARAFWRRLIADAIDRGVDGVNLRVSNHADVLEWKEYGFNAPIVQAYRDRHGVDVTTQPFDMEQWRRLRGEFYTQFLTEAAADIRAKGKTFALHVSDTMQGSPTAPTMMEMHWDWSTWIDKLRPDQVTMKLIGEESYRSHHSREVVRRCAEYGIRVIVCPFLHSVAQRIGGQWPAYLDDLRRRGFAGLDVYEHATCYVNQPNGQTAVLFDFAEQIRS